MTALLHLLRAGCPWRDLPCAGVNWRTVYGYFARWRDAGVWEAILAALTQHQEGRLRFIDSTYVRVNQSACNPVGGPAAQAIGPSRGGRTTKVHALVDSRGRALKLLLTAGNVVDITVVILPGFDGPAGVLQASTTPNGNDTKQIRQEI